MIYNLLRVHAAIRGEMATAAQGVAPIERVGMW
jgi:hypothetical protein